MPRVAVLTKAVHEHDRPAQFTVREALADHRERMRACRHHDVLDEERALVGVDGLFDDLGT